MHTTTMWLGMGILGGIMSTAGLAGADDEMGKAAGRAELAGDRLTASIELDGWVTRSPMSVVASVVSLGNATARERELGLGQCALGPGKAGANPHTKTGKCKWAPLRIGGLPDGNYDVTFVVRRGEFPWGTYYARFVKATPPPSVFGVAVAPELKELVVKLMVRHGAPLEIKLPLALASPVHESVERVFPSVTSNRILAANATQRVADTVLAEALPGNRESVQRAEASYQRALAASAGLPEAARKGAVQAAIAAYNSEVDGYAEALVQGIDERVRGYNRTRAIELARGVSAASVVGSVVGQDEQAPPGGFCAGFLEKLCEGVPLSIAEQIEARMNEYGKDKLGAAHDAARRRFPHH